MTPTPEQDKALLAIDRWLSDKSNPLFSLVGYAGTGKTTTLQHFINNFKGDKQPLCCAPTGKAASVLKTKLTGVNVTTVHHLLYKPTGKSLKDLEALGIALLQTEDSRDKVKLEGLIQIERDRLAKEDVNFETRPNGELLPGRLVIVDEASMVSDRMLGDFKSTGCKLLLVGDDGQLPPVKACDWFFRREHDSRLSTIMRQAFDNPIIRLSAEVRTGKVKCSDYNDHQCTITSKDKMDSATWLAADQVITGRNASRTRLNRFFRKKLGKVGSFPVHGEKMICLKNNYRHVPVWINGVQFTTASDSVQVPVGDDFMFDITYDGQLLHAIEFYPYHCVANYYPEAKELPREDRGHLFECDYGYAITCHKAQGSEWPFVIVADDKMQVDKGEFRRRWLYTAITRAKERLIIVEQQ